MAATAIPLTTVPNEQTKVEIAATIFKTTYDPLKGLSDIEQYLQYYCDETRELKSGFPPDCQAAHLALSTHNDVLKVIDTIRPDTKQTKDQLRQSLRRLFPSSETEDIDMAIDVSLRLWLMINFRNARFRPASKLRRPCVQWDDKENLQTSVKRNFPNKSSWEPTAREGRYDPNFTAAFLVNTCGIQIKWTTSLEDHLRIDRGYGEKTLWIFPYKTYMRKMLADETLLGPRQSPIIPIEVFQESIDSLLLLFPQWDPSTRHLLELHGQTFHSEEPISPPRNLGIKDFNVWRDRLLELNQEVYQVPTPGIQQLWRDRRNIQQWSTFWLAVAIAIMTAISTCTGFVSMLASCAQAWGSRKA